nr:B3 domain-containing protein REM10-like [Ipomoea batatas]
MHYHSPTSSTITWFIVRAIDRQIPICMQQHLIEHVYFTAQLFYGNNAPWEVDVQGLLFSTGWVDFCEALDIKLEDEIVFRHMGFFKFQFFIFQNGERVAILDAQGDGIERNLHLEMLDLLWINFKSSIPGTFALDILSECKSLLVTSYDLQSEPGQLLSFIYNTEPEDEGVNVFHGDKHVYFHSRDYNYGDSFGHLKFILTENNPWGSQSFFVL